MNNRIYFCSMAGLFLLIILLAGSQNNVSEVLPDASNVSGGDCYADFFTGDSYRTTGEFCLVFSAPSFSDYVAMSPTATIQEVFSIPTATEPSVFFPVNTPTPRPPDNDEETPTELPTSTPPPVVTPSPQETPTEIPTEIPEEDDDDDDDENDEEDDEEDEEDD